MPIFIKILNITWVILITKKSSKRKWAQYKMFWIGHGVKVNSHKKKEEHIWRSNVRTYMLLRKIFSLLNNTKRSHAFLQVPSDKKKTNLKNDYTHRDIHHYWRTIAIGHGYLTFPLLQIFFFTLRIQNKASYSLGRFT